MKGETFGKLGGACSILVGISYVLIGVTYLLIPREQQSSNPARFYPLLRRTQHS
jgi:hypothetical protein